jgi:hypothetical protein
VKKINFLFFIFIPMFLFSNGIMDMDSIKPGMKGYGYSIFSENKLDTFNVEILGVLKAVGPERDMIIARLSGAGLEKTGIISGMSGSPVFIDGKMIGAVAYAWPFSLEPITGITPIGEIIATKGDTIYEEGGGKEIKIKGEGKMSPYSGITLTKIKTPLSIAGFDNRLTGDIDKFFGERGFSVVMGGGASGQTTDSDSLFNGAAVSVQLVSGDASMGAVGTVTYVDGDDVFAFGHPLFVSGSVSFPMATAHVYTVVPSLMNSFKIASGEKVIGTILQDRTDAVYGKIGEKPHTIPVDISVKKNREVKTFHFEVIEHKELMPSLIGLTFANSILSLGRGYGSLTISYDMKLKLEKYGELKLSNFFSGENALMFSMNGVNSVIDRLFNDRWEKIVIEGVDLDVGIEECIRSASIETVKPEKFSVRRGEVLDINVILKEMGGETIEKKFAIKIPETYTDSTANIAVVGYNGYTNLQMERSPDFFTTKREGHIIELLKNLPRNNVLYCLLLSSRVGMMVRGYEYGSLPSSMLYLMKDGRGLGEGQFTRGGIVDKKERECGFIVSGQKVLSINIVD